MTKKAIIYPLGLMLCFNASCLGTGPGESNMAVLEKGYRVESFGPAGDNVVGIETGIPTSAVGVRPSAGDTKIENQIFLLDKSGDAKYVKRLGKGVVFGLCSSPSTTYLVFAPWSGYGNELDGTLLASSDHKEWTPTDVPLRSVIGCLAATGGSFYVWSQNGQTALSDVSGRWSEVIGKFQLYSGVSVKRPRMNQHGRVVAPASDYLGCPDRVADSVLIIQGEQITDALCLAKTEHLTFASWIDDKNVMFGLASLKETVIRIMRWSLNRGLIEELSSIPGAAVSAFDSIGKVAVMGVGQGYSRSLLYTTDGGVSWNELHIGETERTIGALDDGRFLIEGNRSGNLYECWPEKSECKTLAARAK